MIEIILSIIVITIALSAMSIGLLVNKPLKGSCGNCECEDKCEPKIDPFGWPMKWKNVIKNWEN